MSDLVQRLRDTAKYFMPPNQLMYEAADEIERLRAEAKCNYCGEYHGKEVCAVLQERIAELESQLHGTVTTKYHDELMHQWHVKVVELEAALREIATQKTTNETLQAGDELGDIEYGYNACVLRARKALKEGL